MPYIDELHRECHAAAVENDISRYDNSGAKARHCLGTGAVCRFEAHGRLPRDHAQGRDRAELRDQQFRDAISEVVIGGFPGPVLDREHHHCGAACRARRDQPVAALRYSLNESWFTRAVAKRLAKSGYCRQKGTVGNVLVRPDISQDIIAAQNLAVTLGEIHQQVHDTRFEATRLAGANDAVPSRLYAPAPDLEFFHRVNPLRRSFRVPATMISECIAFMRWYLTHASRPQVSVC